MTIEISNPKIYIRVANTHAVIDERIVAGGGRAHASGELLSKWKATFTSGGFS
jgi:hypothetical protein